MPRRLKAQLGVRTPYDLTDVNFVASKSSDFAGKGSNAKKKSGKEPVNKLVECKELKGESMDDSFDHTIGFLVSEISTRGKLPLPQTCILHLRMKVTFHEL